MTGVGLLSVVGVFALRAKRTGPIPDIGIGGPLWRKTKLSSGEVQGAAVVDGSSEAAVGCPTRTTNK